MTSNNNRRSILTLLVSAIMVAILATFAFFRWNKTSEQVAGDVPTNVNDRIGATSPEIANVNTFLKKRFFNGDVDHLQNDLLNILSERADIGVSNSQELSDLKQLSKPPSVELLAKNQTAVESINALTYSGNGDVNLFFPLMKTIGSSKPHSRFENFYEEYVNGLVEKNNLDEAEKHNEFLFARRIVLSRAVDLHRIAKIKSDNRITVSVSKIDLPILHWAWSQLNEKDLRLLLSNANRPVEKLHDVVTPATVEIAEMVKRDFVKLGFQDDFNPLTGQDSSVGHSFNYSDPINISDPAKSLSEQIETEKGSLPKHWSKEQKTIALETLSVVSKMLKSELNLNRLSRAFDNSNDGIPPLLEWNKDLSMNNNGSFLVPFKSAITNMRGSRERKI